MPPPNEPPWKGRQTGVIGPRAVPLELAAQVADSGADAAFQAAELRIVLAAALVKLGPLERQVLELQLADLTLQEIADRLGISLRTAKRRCRLGMSRLAEIMGDGRP